MFSPYQLCAPGGGGGGDTAAYVPPDLDLPYIVLCPGFFDLPAIPSGAGNDLASLCPSLDATRNVFADDGGPVTAGQRKGLGGYGIWVLLHELLHLYVRDDLRGRHTIPAEVYGGNECIGLAGKAGVGERNPASWVWVVACEFPFCPFINLVLFASLLVLGSGVIRCVEMSSLWRACKLMISWSRCNSHVLRMYTAARCHSRAVGSAASGREWNRDWECVGREV